MYNILQHAVNIQHSEVKQVEVDYRQKQQDQEYTVHFKQGLLTCAD